MSKKIFIKVLAEFKEDAIIPRSITWEDGRVFEIDRVIDIRPAASLKAGGQGLRYTCQINGQYRYLFLEDGKWFVEGKD